MAKRAPEAQEEVYRMTTSDQRSIEQMQSCLDELGLPLLVCWTPDQTKTVHGEIKGRTLHIYAVSESEVWSTFTHEVLEFQLINVIRPYRLLINSLIEVIEKSIYNDKERFFESLPTIVEVIDQAKGKGRPSVRSHSASVKREPWNG